MATNPDNRDRWTNDRLDRLGRSCEANRTDIAELRNLIESNAKAIQANNAAVADRAANRQNSTSWLRLLGH